MFLLRNKIFCCSFVVNKKSKAMDFTLFTQVFLGIGIIFSIVFLIIEVIKYKRILKELKELEEDELSSLDISTERNHIDLTKL